MLTIQIDLNSRSYGACPWDRAHIEGAIERVPSPTRILRAILHGAFACGVGEHDAVRLLLEKLAHTLPIYYIPDGNYIPLQKHRPDQTGTCRLYQPGKLLSEPYFRYAVGTFFLVGWENVDLASDELNLLDSCLRHCHYLGRSEHLATWKIVSQPQQFNCYPDRSGTETVQCVQSGAIDSLYLSPGLRNARLKSFNFPGFYQATYQIERAAPEIPPDREISFDTVVLALDRALPAPAAIYWCDLLHKALVRAAPATAIFGNGDLKITPVYDDVGCFRKLLLYCAKGFNNFDLSKITAVDRLEGRSTTNIIVTDTYRSTCTSQNMHWTSRAPFFMPLQPSLKFGRDGRIRNTGYRCLPNTKFTRNGATHQALKFFLKHCGIQEKAIAYTQDGDWLLAIASDEQIAGCQAVEWVDYAQWQTERFSGTQFERIQPPVPIGYRLSILSSLPVRGGLSLGYGKNFGLGVLCGAVQSLAQPLRTRIVAVGATGIPRQSRRVVET